MFFLRKSFHLYDDRQLQLQPSISFFPPKIARENELVGCRRRRAGPIDSQLNFPATAQVEATTRTVQRHQMAAPTPLRPATLNPTELQLCDASLITARPNGYKYVNLKGCPNINLKGTVKSLSASDSGRVRIELAVAKEDAESLSSFCETHLKPALANALAVPQLDAIALGGKKVPAYKKLKTSPTAATPAIQLKFYYTIDKYDSTKAIINISSNTITQFYCVDLEAQKANKVDGITQNADTEATCWISISRNDMEPGLYYVNLMPKQVVYVESAEPESEVKHEDAPSIAFGGISFAA